MKKIFLIFRVILLIICIAVFVVSVVMLAKIIVGYSEADDFYNKINSGVDTENNEKDNSDVPNRLIELSLYVQELKTQYPDIVGYINIPSIGISYPVVQSGDNDYYLNHLIDGTENTSGAIFLDYRISKEPLETKNTVLYGHNMNNGSMFHGIEEFFNDRSLFDNAVIEYVTETAIYVYEPFALYRCDAFYPFYMYEFSNEENYLDFCNMISEKAYYLSDVEYDGTSSLISLATCVNSLTTKNARYIYHAVLSKTYTNIHGDG